MCFFGFIMGFESEEADYPLKIKLPKKVVSYFRERNNFTESLPSYHDLRCKKRDYSGDISRAFGSDNLFFGSMKISENDSGHTRPLRIYGLNNGRFFYAKKPSYERIFGLAFFNFFSCSEQCYRFNNSVFIEEGIKGEHLSLENVDRLIDLPNFNQSLVTLNVFDTLFPIFNDINVYSSSMNGLDNFVVSDKGDCIPIDFHTAFIPGICESKGVLVDKVRRIGVNISNDLEKEVELFEANRILKRIHERFDEFSCLVGLADSVKYITCLLKFSGYNSVRDFFDRRIRILEKIV
jgi:hypothetical protein